MAEYKDSPTALIADVDCTTSGKSLCSAHGLQGYNGGRSLVDLRTFAAENLGPSCGPTNLDLCDDAKRKQIEDLMALPADELASQVDEMEKELAAAEKKFEKQTKALQKKYEEFSKAKDEAVAAIKGKGLG